ncbi:MAG: translocation and assembly module TamB, partial [Paraglaciecola sp.]
MSAMPEDQKAIAKPVSIKSIISKFISGILKLTLVLVMVVCLFIGFLLTPWGTQSVVSVADNLVDELTIDYHSGGVGSELRLASLKWKQFGSNIDIDNLRLSIKLSCVWRFAVCIDSVSTDKMVVQIQPSESAQVAEPTTSALTLPIAVSIENLSLNAFSLKVQDTADVTWQKLTGKLDFYQFLRIEKMQLHGFHLTTYAIETPAAATQAEPFDWSHWQYQPMTAIPIVLPIHFDVLAFDMSAARLQLAGQQEVELKKVSLKAKGSKNEVQLHELFVEHEQGQLLAKGNVQLKGQFEHVFSVDANVEWVEQTPLQLTLLSSGNINAVSTQVELIETRLSTKTQTAKTQTANAQVKPLKLVIDLTAQPAKATLPVNLSLDWSHLQWPLAEPELKSESGAIHINGDLNALKITIQTMLAGKNVPDTHINLSAIGVSTAQNKSFELNEFLLETLGGQVLSKGKINFSEFINWQGNSTISHIDPSVFWPELVADINGEVVTQAN